MESSGPAVYKFVILAITVFGATDAFPSGAHPTFTLYNPHKSAKWVEFNATARSMAPLRAGFDLFDTVSATQAAKGCTSAQPCAVKVEADSAVVLVAKKAAQ